MGIGTTHGKWMASVGLPVGVVVAVASSWPAVGSANATVRKVSECQPLPNVIASDGLPCVTREPPFSSSG